MRIAGAIIALFVALIVLVQSLAVGTADALENKGGDGGSWGFIVAVLFVVGAALLFGKVMKGALWVWVAAAALAWAGAASSVFSDLWLWGFVALVYAVGCYWGLRKAKKVARKKAKPSTSVATPTPIS